MQKIKEKFKDIKISHIFIAIIITNFLCLFIANILETFLDFKYHIYGLRYDLAKNLNPESISNRQNGLTQNFITIMTGDLKQDLQKGQVHVLIKELKELDQISLSEKRKTLLFIPQNNQIYWRLNGAKVSFEGEETSCAAIPFLAPALTGIAMLDGMPPVECEVFAYGYNLYQKREGKQQLSADNPKQLCSEAIAKGFSQVIVLTEKAGNLITKTHLCK